MEFIFRQKAGEIKTFLDNWKLVNWKPDDLLFCLFSVLSGVSVPEWWGWKRGPRHATSKAAYRIAGEWIKSMNIYIQTACMMLLYAAIIRWWRDRSSLRGSFLLILYLTKCVDHITRCALASKKAEIMHLIKLQPDTVTALIPLSSIRNLPCKYLGLPLHCN